MPARDPVQTSRSRLSAVLGVTPLRVRSWLFIGVSLLVQATDHVLQKNVSVITVCLGIWMATTRSVVCKAVDRAYEQGVITICAAGQYVDGVVSPASLPRTVAVAGTTFEDVPWGHSCHGPEVDLSGPAADIKSAAAKLHSGKPTYSYADAGDGTTYATAMVSGAAALCGCSPSRRA